MTLREFEKYIQNDFTSYEDFCARLKLTVPDNFNFSYDVMDVLAQKCPNKPALLWTNVAGEEHCYTFRDIVAGCNRAANLFKSLGIGKGDKVMLILKRHPEFWFSILALHKLGAVCIPATHLLMPKDIVYRLNAAEIKLIVCTNDGDTKERVEKALPECPSVEHKIIVREQREGWLNYEQSVAEMSAEFEKPQGNELAGGNDDMLLYFTSGTSGMPKMVAHNFNYPLGHIITAVFWHNCDPDGRHLTVADSGWMKCVWGKLYGQWLAETCVFVYDFDKFVAADMLRVIEKYKVTTFCAPPTIYRFFIQEDLSQYDLSCLKYSTTAGEALNPEVFARWKEYTGLTIMESFGQTETCGTVGNFLWMTPKPGSMGKPNPLYDIDVVDENGCSCGAGEIGEIVVNTKNGAPVGMFKDYYHDPEQTLRAWHDDVYHTGDTAWRDETGYYWYVGRADDIIKSSGYRIGPFEVESALMEHPAVMETAITGVPHPIRGQVVKATIVLAKGYEPSDELAKELQSFVKKTTAPYKYPRVIEFVDELPKTISGKIRRVEIRGEHHD